MTYRIIPAILCVLLFASGCSSLKQVTSGNTKTATSARPAVVNKNPKFLDNISVTPEPSTVYHNEGGNANRKNSRAQNNFPSSSEIETATPLQFKYALLLNTEVEEIRNPALFSFIDDWYGTRYCMGGTTKNCIDCSAFVQSFFAAMYTISLPRTSLEQFTRAKRISKKDLEEGDLVFFKTSGRSISHVGVYLRNNKFVHAATSGGVMISDITEDYFARRFAGSGRVKE